MFEVESKSIIMVCLKYSYCEILHRLKRETSASENVGSRKGMDCEILRNE